MLSAAVCFTALQAGHADAGRDVPVEVVALAGQPITVGGAFPEFFNNTVPGADGPPVSLAGEGLVFTNPLFGDTVTERDNVGLYRGTPGASFSNAPFDADVTTLTRNGRGLPGVPFGQTLFSLGQPEIPMVGNAQGDVLLGGRFEQGGFVLSYGLFRFVPGNPNALPVVVSGTPATDVGGQPLPGGVLYPASGVGGEFDWPRFNDAGQVLFRSALDNPTQPTDAGIWLTPATTPADPNPTPRQIARHGAPIPNAAAALNALPRSALPNYFQTFPDAVPEAEYALVPERQGFVLAPDGRVVFRTSVGLREEGGDNFGTPGLDTIVGSTEAIVELRLDPDNAAQPVAGRPLVFSGQPLNDPAMPGYRLGNPRAGLSVNGLGQTVFAADVIDENDISLGGLVLHTPDPSDPDNPAADELTYIVRNQDELPAVPGAAGPSLPETPRRVSSLSDPVVSDAGEVFFRSALIPPPGQAAQVFEAVGRYRAGQGAVALAQTGQVAPGGLLFDEFGRIATGPTGDLVFAATLTDPAAPEPEPGVVDPIAGVFVHEFETDALRPVLQTGDTVTLSLFPGEPFVTDEFTVLSATIAELPGNEIGAESTSGQDGRPRYLDDAGRVAVWAALERSDSARLTAMLVIDLADALPVFGDYNDNGQVEQGDLDLVLFNWGQTPTNLTGPWINQRPTGDFVGQRELDVVLQEWGSTAAPGLSARVVPEPAGGAWLALVGPAVSCGSRRRRR